VGWLDPRSCRFTPGKDPVPIVQEAGWAPGPVWTGAENLAPTGIRSLDRPASSESLYRLRYPGPQNHPDRNGFNGKLRAGKQVSVTSHQKEQDVFSIRDVTVVISHYTSKTVFKISPLGEKS
jgi:hypothetical protein